MKKKEPKKVLIQKGMTVGMIFFLLLAAEGCQKKDTSVTDPSDSNIKQEETQKNTDQKNEDSDTEKSGLSVFIFKKGHKRNGKK